jgi:hypothetical protein
VAEEMAAQITAAVLSAAAARPSRLRFVVSMFMAKPSNRGIVPS